DYNVSVTIHPYRQGRMEDCLHLLDTLAEEVQGIALCAADCPQVRQKLELLAERRMPVVTFNSDIAGARRLCYVGEDA
ncbi:Ferrous iron transport protein A, partial [Dysosmobacter welbionis]